MTGIPETPTARRTRKAFGILMALAVPTLAVLMAVLIASTMSLSERSRDRGTAIELLVDDVQTLRGQLNSVGVKPDVPPPSQRLNDNTPGLAGANGKDGRDGFTITGPVGPKGEKGDKGERGDTGPMGLTGFPGASVTGPPGRDGLNGGPGPVGPAGKDGLSITGPAGKDGTNGKDGAPGPAGMNGADGQPGTPGPTCPQGTTLTPVLFADGQSGYGCVTPPPQEARR